MWYWAWERDGVYTVKSAYKMLAGDGLDIAEQSDGERGKWLWNRLLKVPVWPRIKLFFWQLCGEALATKANIAARIGGLGMACEEVRGGGEVRGWVESRWQELGCKEYSKFMVGCWAIWEHRNKVVFEGAEVAPHSVIRRVMDVLSESMNMEVMGREVRRRGGRMVRSDECDGWKAAPAGYVKLNVDAGVVDGDEVDTGVVCRDEHGLVVWGAARGRRQGWEPVVAKAVAMLDGLQEALERSHRNVVVESDCLEAVDAVKGKRNERSIFSLIIDDISSLCNSFRSVIFLHTSRVNNCVTHALAHIRPRVFGKMTWSDNLPPVPNDAVIFYLSLLK
ncbi:uncharacterized protein LOC141631977 [Silene latifolia]|uniref:uncharacterized protein LOC141631977 n=1 Tax=Silene latifolia TaxID=37657 RepID=UPI003D77F699